jgi:hypothetical protein
MQQHIQKGCINYGRFIYIFKLCPIKNVTELREVLQVAQNCAISKD